MGKVTDNLQPKDVFRYFGELCSIPHGSGNVKKISDYCVEFAKEHGLKYRQDESYNVIIWKEASAGYEDKPTVILQGHLDMVAVKDADCTKDMENDGLDLEADGDYLYAKKTSLGGDDGIAIAYSLALLASAKYEHPALEAIFTVDEEIGMLGAAALDLSDIKGRIMMNMDSEEEGIFLAGCAGGGTAACTVPVEKCREKGVLCKIKIDGLRGGHSGTEIICQRANANVLMGRVLFRLSQKTGFSVLSISGGEKDNAISKIAKAELIIKACDADTVKNEIGLLEKDIKNEYAATDEDLKITVSIENQENSYDVFSDESSEKLIMALIQLPYGVQKMSNDIQGLVQTSLNLGIIKENSEGVVLYYSVRSSLGSEKDFLVDKIKAFMRFIGGKCEMSGLYPAWEYVRDSYLRDKMVAVYEKMYNEKPKVETIHAGVECGIIADKLGKLDCVSFGPDIMDIHTTKERLSISSVERTWKFILEVLKEL